MTYYNPLDDGSAGGIGDLIEPAVQAMNDAILAEIDAHGTGHVDAHAYFANRAPELIGSDHIHPSAAGHDLLANLFTNAVPPDADADGLSDAMEGVFGTDPGAAVADSDGDGCSDGTEVNADAGHGGERDPANFWDFMFVFAGIPLTRDVTVSGGDVAAIVLRFGSNDVGSGPFNRSSHPLSTPSLAVPPSGTRANYHPSYDRGGTVLGQGPLALLPPDGSISGGGISGPPVGQYPCRRRCSQQPESGAEPVGSGVHSCHRLRPKSFVVGGSRLVTALA